MYNVYILKMNNDSYYIGSTKDLSARLLLHKNGKVYSTKHKLPYTLMYTESHQDRSNAQTREYQIKKWKSRKAIERLFKK